MNEPDPPDERGPAIVVLGSLLTGHELFGPWPTIDAALADVARMKLPARTTVVLLKPCAELPFLPREAAP